MPTHPFKDDLHVSGHQYNRRLDISNADGEYNPIRGTRVLCCTMFHWMDASTTSPSINLQYTNESGLSGVYFFYPEVKGMTLEDIREVFNPGFGVEYARGIQRELERKKKNQASGGISGVEP